MAQNKSNIDTEKGSVALNFHVPVEFKKKFKIAAVNLGITQTELLKVIFDEWEKEHNINM